MKEREIAEKNKILEIRSGSHLYGLNTENSDEDYIGIFLAPIEYHLGLQKVEQIDLSFKDKLESGRNSKDAIDKTFYELKRFVKLALDNNPNILEVLFVDEKNIIYINEFGRRLLNLKKEFLSKKIIKTFLGYAKSQKRKLMIKKDNLDILFKTKDFLERFNLNEGLILPELKDEPEFKELFKVISKDVYGIGEYNINKNTTIKEALKKVNEIIKNSSNRKELIKEYGYDTKFAYHLVRILLELYEMITTNNLVFPLREKDMLMKIKLGKVDIETLFSIISDIEIAINSIIDSKESLLKDKPNYDVVEKELISIYLDFIFK